MSRNCGYATTRPTRSRFISAASPNSLSISNSHRIGWDRNTSGNTSCSWFSEKGRMGGLQSNSVRVAVFLPPRAAPRLDDEHIPYSPYCRHWSVSGRGLAPSSEVARRQRAKSWEPRATSSLARLLAKHGRRSEARSMLAEIYNWFTEGFDTADLKEANALLDELAT
jgi:hypothetical protein